MKVKSLKILTAVVAVLIVALLILNQGRNSMPSHALLFPELKSRINDVVSVIVRSGSDTVSIARPDDRWSIRERNDYAADLGVLRTILLSLADARIVEHKTGDPEKYHLLGVNDPADENSDSVEIAIKGGDFEYVVILGKIAQSKFRYARIAGETQSVLIDRNPELPDDTGGWVSKSLLEIAANRLHRIVIAHNDGETIEIESDTEAAGSFKVANIPAGRELTYPSVANGMGSVLSDLSLEDVRKAPENPVAADVVTTFTTDDGLTLEVATFKEDELSWISISAKATASEESENNDEVVSEADSINSRLAAWQYTLPDYKAKLLQRRFEDLLKAKDAE